MLMIQIQFLCLHGRDLIVSLNSRDNDHLLRDLQLYIAKTTQKYEGAGIIQECCVKSFPLRSLLVTLHCTFKLFLMVVCKILLLLTCVYLSDFIFHHWFSLDRLDISLLNNLNLGSTLSFWLKSWLLGATIPDYSILITAHLFHSTVLCILEWLWTSCSFVFTCVHFLVCLFPSSHRICTLGPSVCLLNTHIEGVQRSSLFICWQVRKEESGHLDAHCSSRGYYWTSE